MNNLILNFIIFMKYNKEIVNCIFNQNLAQTLRIKKGSKTKCLETLTGVAPPITRNCNQLFVNLRIDGVMD